MHYESVFGMIREQATTACTRMTPKKAFLYFFHLQVPVPMLFPFLLPAQCSCKQLKYNTDIWLLTAENPMELPWAPPAPWSCRTKSQRAQNNSLKLQWVDSAAHFWGLSQYVSYLGFSWKLDCLADERKADSKGKRCQRSEATWTTQRKYLHGQQVKVTWSSN